MVQNAKGPINKGEELSNCSLISNKKDLSSCDTDDTFRALQVFPPLESKRKACIADIYIFIFEFILRFNSPFP